MEDSDLIPTNAEELSWYQPVFNVAKHYRWSVGIHLPFIDDGFDVPNDIDFSIVPSRCAVTASARGMDISQLLWDEGNVNSIPKHEEGFYYLTIPAGTQPELVLDTLSSLRK